MDFSSEIACFFGQQSLILTRETLIKESSLIWKNNAGNIAEERIKMWQILLMTELVSVEWKYTNIKCFLL